jgi:hypothetical protein
MNRLDFKSFAIIEILILVLTGIFLYDFLPRNHNEYLTICQSTWPKDPVEYQICLKPYYGELNFDKYVIGVGVAALVLFPAYYLISKKNKIKDKKGT